PIVEMTGAHTFNEVFLDDVRIPAENIVGEPGDGWRLAKVTLANERVSLSSGGALWGMGPSARDLIDLVREAGGVDDPVLRSRLVDLHIESEILRLIRLRTVSAAVRGEAPGPEASIRKVLADEHGQHVFELAKDLAGAHGMLTDGGPLGRPVGVWHHGFLFSRALTIGGGTAEVQRNIIGERVLGLPPEPDVAAPRPGRVSRRPSWPWPPRPRSRRPGRPGRPPAAAARPRTAGGRRPRGPPARRPRAGRRRSRPGCRRPAPGRCSAPPGPPGRRARWRRPRPR